MKKEFCFTKFLTNRDIEKILTSVGMELIKDQYNKNGDLLKPIIRSKDEDGKTNIIVRCRFNEETKEKMSQENDKIIMNLSPELKKILFPMFMFSSLGNFGRYSKYSDMMMLQFEDFVLYEILSLKDDDEQIKFGRMLTSKYHDYMKEKFGKFYVYKEAAYIKKLRKEAREESADESQKEENTLEKE